MEDVNLVVRWKDGRVVPVAVHVIAVLPLRGPDRTVTRRFRALNPDDVASRAALLDFLAELTDGLGEEGADVAAAAPQAAEMLRLLGFENQLNGSLPVELGR